MEKAGLRWSRTEGWGGSWEARMPEVSVLCRAGKAIFDSGFSSPRQEGRSEMIPARGFGWLQCLTLPILAVYLHTIFGLCVCFSQCDKATSPPPLPPLEKCSPDIFFMKSAG